MAVAISVFEIHLPSARSLKEKRRVVHALVERLHRRYRVSVAETDFHDLHQRAEISVAAVASSGGELEKLLDDLRRTIDGEPEAMLTAWNPQILEEVT